MTWRPPTRRPGEAAAAIDFYRPPGHPPVTNPPTEGPTEAEKGNPMSQQYAPKIKLAGMWERTSQNGNSYLVGRLGSARLLAFRNTSKQNDNEPDWQLFLQELPPQDGQRS